jgi:hypothetical protein
MWHGSRVHKVTMKDFPSFEKKKKKKKTIYTRLAYEGAKIWDLEAVDPNASPSQRCRITRREFRCNRSTYVDVGLATLLHSIVMIIQSFAN